MGRVKDEVAARNCWPAHKMIEKQVGGVSLAKRGKKSTDDAFAVGTAELHLKRGTPTFVFR